MPQPTLIRFPSTYSPSSESLAAQASCRFEYWTKPQFRPRRRSSSVRGHMIFTDSSCPYRAKILASCASVVAGEMLPT